MCLDNLQNRRALFSALFWHLDTYLQKLVKEPNIPKNRLFNMSYWYLDSSVSEGRLLAWGQMSWWCSYGDCGARLDRHVLCQSWSLAQSLHLRIWPNHHRLLFIVTELQSRSSHTASRERVLRVLCFSGAFFSTYRKSTLQFSKGIFVIPSICI